eukprot:4725622-Lingulodinium_polyedra.AAC.1
MVGPVAAQRSFLAKGRRPRPTRAIAFVCIRGPWSRPAVSPCAQHVLRASAPGAAGQHCRAR